MTVEEIKNVVNNTQKGAIKTLTYSRPMKVRKGVDDSIIKMTTMQVRFGVRYDNMAVTKEGRATGMLPSENQGLAPSLVWVDNNFIKNIKNGNMMLRVAFANGNKTVTKYYRNGMEVNKEDIVPMCLASEFSSKSAAPSVMNIGVEKIVKIN